MKPGRTRLRPLGRSPGAVAYRILTDCSVYASIGLVPMPSPGHPDGADAYPLDPTRWELPPPDPGDTTPPVITLTEPTNAVLISVVPPI